MLKYIESWFYKEEEKCPENCECAKCKPVKKSVKFFVPITKMPCTFDSITKD